MRQLILEEKLAIIRLLFSLSVNEATAEFNAQNERKVTSMTVRRIKKTMMTTGNIQRKKRSDIGIIRKPFWFPRLVLRLYRKKPHTSLRQAARRFNTSVDSILKVLKSLKLRPYRCTVTQELYPGDEEKRKEYCSKILRLFARDPVLQSNVLWSDECLFPLNGIFNRQNYR